jgi:hypothetical protein
MKNTTATKEMCAAKITDFFFVSTLNINAHDSFLKMCNKPFDVKVSGNSISLAPMANEPPHILTTTKVKHITISLLSILDSTPAKRAIFVTILPMGTWIGETLDVARHKHQTGRR